MNQLQLRMNQPQPHEPNHLHEVQQAATAYLVNEEVHGVRVVLNHLQEAWESLPGFGRPVPHGLHHALHHRAGE